MKSGSLFDKLLMIFNVAYLVTLVIALVFNPGNAALFFLLATEMVILLTHGRKNYINR